MEKRQAVEFLEYLRQDRNLERTIYEDALNMAIEALKAQLFSEDTTSAQPVATDTNVGDTISRQTAIDALDFEIVHMTAYCDGKNEGNPFAQYNKGLEDGKKAIEALPTAQPEPQEGHWINGKCDRCGEHAPFWCMASTYHESNYCPNCGAKMKGGAG